MEVCTIQSKDRSPFAKEKDVCHIWKNDPKEYIRVN